MGFVQLFCVASAHISSHRRETMHFRNCLLAVAVAAIAVFMPLDSNALADSFNVSISGFEFIPDTLVIHVGDTVTWTNNDGPPHTTTSDDAVWDSGTLTTGQTFTFVFNTSGVFPYFCAIHPTMRGEIIVLEEVYTISQIYDNLDAVDGREVNVYGSFLNPAHPLLVTNYWEYYNRRKDPPRSRLWVDGATPNAAYFEGGRMVVTGTVSFQTNPHPPYPDDTLMARIDATSFEYIVQGYGIGPEPSEADISFDPDACDPCKFAIFISGGIDSANNDPGFWEDIEALYEHKVNNEDYCPENIHIAYFEGNSEDTGVIPDSAVDEATIENIRSIHEEVARKIAECNRDGDTAVVQKMVSNHGTDEDGINLLGNEHIAPESLRVFQQILIDSCCRFMYDEFTQCYGGDMADSLKNLDDLNKTEIHVNSAAGGESCAWGTSVGSPYLLTKIDRLAAGDDYENAVDSAKAYYDSLLQVWRDNAQDEIDSLNAILDTLTGPDSLRSAIEDEIEDLEGTRDDLDDSINDGSVSWVRHQFKEYCEWKKIVVPPGGQARLKFAGSGGCGNVTIYKENPDGSKERVRVLNWNLPGSLGFQPGNDERVINGDDDSTCVFWIHNDNGEFTVTTDALNDQVLSESVSNPEEFAGFSVGGTDGSSAEFSDIVAPFYVNEGVDSIGFNLLDAPSTIGPCGVGQYQFIFDVHPSSPFWSDVRIQLEVLSLDSPGPVTIICETAEVNVQTINIDSAGTYTADLGAIFSTGQATVLLEAGTSPVCFVLDSWGLRSNLETFPQFTCGDVNATGGIDIDDIVYLIAFVFQGGDPPMPLEAGDVNCSGGVDIDDIVYLIAYVFQGGPAPCNDGAPCE